MDIKTFPDELLLSGQIQASDIALLAKQGVRSIICNRPDGEAEDQARFDDIRKEAEAAGIEVKYLPVIPNQISDENVLEFTQAIDEMPKPTLAYCRTGTRCANLWSLSQANSMPVDAILTTAKEAGYDLTALSERLKNGGRLKN